jgi:hypothetical protein
MELNANTVREKVLEEIKLLPEDQLPEILSFIHSFRLRLAHLNAEPDQATSFAGIWRDMPDEIYAEFINDITTRRQTALSRRRNREAGIG